MAYAQARRDFEYLESIAELDDHVPLMDDLQDLMKNPTKARAAELYESGISLWFSEHKGEFKSRRVAGIARRHDHEYLYNSN